MKQINNFFEVNHIDLYKHPILNNIVCNLKLSQKLAPKVFQPLPFLDEIYKFFKNFFLITLILTNLNMHSSEKFVLNMNTNVLHIIMMSESFQLHFGLHSHLPVNCKHKHLIKFLFIIAVNWTI